MNANLHPIMAEALRPFVKPRRTDGPWEYDADASEVIAPHCGYHDEPIATVSALDGEGRGNGFLLAAAPELRLALARIVAELPQRRDWLDPDIERFAKLVLAKADGITA
jgi:hypothetical protein